MACCRRHGHISEDAWPRIPAREGPGLFEHDHVHMALIVAPNGRLVTTIERPDLTAATSSSTPVAKLGTLIGRTVGPADPLGAATATLLRERRRRLAVVDDSGRLLGLLCLKKDGTGYCSDEGIRERAQTRYTAAEPAFSGRLPWLADSHGTTVGAIEGVTQAVTHVSLTEVDHDACRRSGPAWCPDERGAGCDASAHRGQLLCPGCGLTGKEARCPGARRDDEYCG